MRAFFSFGVVSNPAAKWIALLLITSTWALGEAGAENGVDPDALASQVTIHRDTWGVPHVDGKTDEAAAFGFGYAQAEDYFWQIEDSYLQAIGRYAEVAGERGLRADLLNRNFRIAERSREDFANHPEETQAICAAFVAGINFYLKTHPEVQPRIITDFEPWMVIAFGRFTMLDWTYIRTGASPDETYQYFKGLEEAVGSNLWAIGPSRTADETTMLFVNPHQPWFGAGQFWEGHIRSEEGWNMTGACFFGTPYPTMGHNEHLGWTHTANKPDVGDLYTLTFDDPDNPLAYRWDGGWRQATERTEIIPVKVTQDKIEQRRYTFRETHLGPIVDQLDDNTRLALKVANLFEGDRIGQGIAMNKATNFDEFYEALSRLNLLMFNVGYADKEGNIAYIYQGAIPERPLGYDWSGAVPGTPETQWDELHELEEMPQVINPETGWLQNCNQSPWTTTDYGNPSPGDFPPYMVQEPNYDNRRAEVSRYHLRKMQNVTFEDWKKAVVDTTMLWAVNEIPVFANRFERLKERAPELAERVEPYWNHLKDWDGVITADSTEATLAVTWYEQMYGELEPSEKLADRFIENPDAQFEALAEGAEDLDRIHGAWKVPYGEVFRIQRLVNVGDFRQTILLFSDDLPSIPSLGGAGAFGTSYNVYYSPSTTRRKRRYGAIGGSFMAVYEFGERIKSETLIQFGQSADPESPHHFDQAELYSNREFKPGWFYWEDVLANTEASYRPGERAAAPVSLLGG